MFEKMDNKKKDQLWRDFYQGWGKQTYFDDFISPLSQFISTNKCQGALLDLGCGDGNKSYIFEKLGFDVTGIDASSTCIEQAKNKCPTSHFVCKKLQDKLPFPDNTFDVIFSFSVFQYIDHESILKECRRVLKHNGHIILIENLKNNPITKLGRRYLKLKKFPYQSYPWNHFTKNEIIELKNIFCNVNIKYFHLLTPLAQIKLFKNLYPFLHYLDKKLLKIKLLEHLSWMVIFTGQNNKGC